MRAYVKDNFVDKGMCADFAIHDKGTGNPHVHIMLTLRPLKENGQWGAKCRKAYDLDENGQRIPDGKGGWKNHREDTTDWNDKGNVEIWRAAWAAYTNRVLEAAGQPALVDHRSYKRQGIDKIPSVHLGPAASQMEKRGIRTDKGEVNRQIAADNKLLKEIKARITRLYRWSKDEAEKPQTQQSSLTALWEAQQQLNTPRTRTGKIRALQESAALFSFLQANGIQSMQQLHEKIADMNSRYYDLRGKIVKAERRITTLTERGEMWEQYNQYKSIHKQLAKVKPEKREQFEQRHSRELILYDAAARYLKELKDSDEAITNWGAVCVSSHPLISIVALLPSVFVIISIVIFPPESIKKCKSVKCCNCIFQISVICNRPFIIQPVQNLCCKTIAVINGIDFIFIM